MVQNLWWIPVGLIIGTFGTLIGAGGGFVLTPMLLLAYPHESPELITSISLAVVFCNALSGSVAYARMHRIDYQSGVLFSLATIPGAVFGALTTSYIPRRTFNLIFGGFMIVVAVFLLMRASTVSEEPQKMQYRVRRTLIDTTGTSYTFSYNRSVGVGLSLLVGYISSVLGIGGGILHVPAMVHLLHFPVHIATATSHFTLAVMTLAGTLVHIATGMLQRGIWQTIALGIGVLCGAQLGAHFSHYVRGQWIIRSLAIALGLVGIRILALAFY